MSRGLSTGAIVAIALSACCIGSVLIGAFFVNRDLSTTQPIPAAADPFDRAAFDAYWAGPNVTPRTRSLVTSVDWAGGALTAHTALTADADAIEPATTICGALSGYWLLQRGEFQPVRVVDGADQVLVSRHVLAESCTWRR